MVAQWTMEIFPGQTFEVCIRNLSAIPIFFTKNMVVAYVSMATEYVVYALGSEADYEQPKRNDSDTNN